MATSYTDVLVGRRHMGETCDCSVATVSILCDMPYAEAHALLASAGRKPRHGFSLRRTNDTIADLGYHVDRIPVAPFVYAIRAASTRTRNRRTLVPGDFRTLAAGIRSMPQRVVAVTKGHAIPVRDGVVQDDSMGRRAPIRWMYMVTPKAEAHVRTYWTTQLGVLDD